jgi:formylglycine-generating enzyme required for sulfatase activity
VNTANKFLLVWALGLTALLLMGLTIPHAFTPGSTISSAEMNANFVAVKAAVDALEAQSTANTSQIAGLSPESGLSPRQIQYARDHGLPAVYVEPTTGMRFVLIAPGEFLMGSPASEAGHSVLEAQRHVRLSQAFYLSAYEVTNAQYRLYDAGHTSTADGDDQPVTEVSHDDAVAFAAWLTSQGRDLPYGLPTEAQWEYACRAGTTAPFSFGANVNAAQVNYDGSSPYDGALAGLQRAAPTDGGSFPANAWGLYDMHGNVWEWCVDYRGPLLENLTSVTVDPVVTSDPGSGVRVLRGGSWEQGAAFARSASRAGDSPTSRSPLIGFRLVRSAVAPGG